MLPLGGLTVTDAEPQPPPLAVTEKNTAAPFELVASATILDGQLTLKGGVAARRCTGPSHSRLATNANKIRFAFMAELALKMVCFSCRPSLTPNLVQRDF
jgi:hypothetical protein